MTTKFLPKRLNYFVLTASLLYFCPVQAQGADPGPLGKFDYSTGPASFVRSGSDMTDTSKTTPIDSEEESEEKEKDDVKIDFDKDPLDTKTKKVKEEDDFSFADEDKDGTAKDNQSTLLEDDRKLIEKTEQDLAAKQVESPTITLNRVKLLMKKGHFTLALQEVNKCLTYDRNNWTARHLGAMCLQAQGRNKEAITRFKEYLVYKPDDVHANINVGTIYRAEEEFEEAEKHYRKAIAVNYYSLEAHYNLANVLMDQGNLREAIKELRVCLKLDPRNAKVHNNLGVLFLKRDYLEDAMDEFTRATRLDPANKDYQNNLLAVKQKMKAKK